MEGKLKIRTLGEMSNLTRCISIGFGAKASRDLEIVLRVALTEDPSAYKTLRAVMTEAEFEAVYAVMCRLIKDYDFEPIDREDS